MTGSDTAVWVCVGNEPGVRVETWFCIMAGTEFCASTGLATWGCAGTEAGVEDKTCVEAWAATCGRAGTGVDI